MTDRELFEQGIRNDVYAHNRKFIQEPQKCFICGSGDTYDYIGTKDGIDVKIMIYMRTIGDTTYSVCKKHYKIFSVVDRIVGMVVKRILKFI